MRFCTNCGAELQEQIKFCPSCGTQIQTISNGAQSKSYPIQNAQPRSSKDVMSGLLKSAKNGIAGVVHTVQSRPNQSEAKNAYMSYVGSHAEAENTAMLTNCPNCGSAVDSMSARCGFCGTELIHNSQAFGCKELCDRLDLIEASRPKETVFSFVTGLANKALDQNKLAPTDQQKIELISNFVVPNTKADIMEFLFLAKTRIEACNKLSSSDDEYVAMVQDELLSVWKTKFEQTIKKAKLVLSNDPDFNAFYMQYLKEQEEEDRRINRLNRVCQYCGGKFKGFTHKTCVKCGKPKDY